MSKYFLQRFVAARPKGKWNGVEMFEDANDHLALEYMASYLNTVRSQPEFQHRVIDENGNVVCAYYPVNPPPKR